LPILRQAYLELRHYLSEKQLALLLDGLVGGKHHLLLLSFSFKWEELKTLVFPDDTFWTASSKSRPSTKKEYLTSHDIKAGILLLLGECGDQRGLP
jgi:hypothetical protein